MPDAYEQSYPCLDWLHPDGSADPDADGMTNYYEYVIGTDPCDPDTIALTSPNGDEDWEAYTDHDITWSSTGMGINYVDLECSTDGGSSWSALFSYYVPNTGSYNWAVPFVSSDQCLVRLTGYHYRNYIYYPVGQDVSDAVFQIYLATIAVASPNGAETWEAGTMHDITWTTTGTTITHVTLEASTNAGDSWSSIFYGYAPNSGGYSWMLPFANSDQCLVRLTGYHYRNYIYYPVGQDASDSTFAILTCDDDIDRDGMPNCWELEHLCLHPTAPDGALDPDGDCLPSLLEYTRGTNPCAANPDIDGDGMPNCYEVNQPCLNPAVADGAADADHDGLSNLAEYLAGTNPCENDCDDYLDCTLDFWGGDPIGCQHVVVDLPCLGLGCDDLHPCFELPGWEVECFEGVCVYWPECLDDSDCAEGECCTEVGCVPCGYDGELDPDVLEQLDLGRDIVIIPPPIGTELYMFTSGPTLPATAYGQYTLPANAGFLTFEYQWTDPAPGQVLSLAFGSMALWHAMPGRSVGPWQSALVYVGHVSGMTDWLQFALTAGSPPGYSDMVHIRNMRLFDNRGIGILGDLDRDRDVDIDDFNLFAPCMAGPQVGVIGDCRRADVNGDDDADLVDFATLQRVFGQSP